MPEVDEALVGVGVGLAAGMGRRPPTAIFVAMGGGGGGSPARQGRPVDASFAAAALAKTRIFKTSFPVCGQRQGEEPKNGTEEGARVFEFRNRARAPNTNLQGRPPARLR